jgi:ABC-type Zn uptake system ZnuABC Zn-binding protein ZnuA
VIGDVVSHIGRDRIDLIVLMQAGQDPHSYEPSAQELAAVALADVTLVNGWDLEAGLLDDLRQVAEKGPVIPVSANVVPLASSEGIDPHVWLNPHNVLIWTDNLEQILGALDPGGASEYRQNGLGYRAELRSLLTYIDEQIGSIDPTDRVMVTNHDALGHFAVQYGFEIVGTILPALDSMSEPSAGELSQLVEQLTRADVCAIYTEHTASDRLAKATAAELDGCESVALIPLYTGALGPVGSQADSYIGMMRQNVEAIVAGQNEGTE